MDKAEAQGVLAEEVRRLRALSYTELRGRIASQPRRFLGIPIAEEPEWEGREVTAESGTTYQLESQVFWDGKERDNLRVFVTVHEGRSRAFRLLTDDFILAPDGSFVGE